MIITAILPDGFEERSKATIGLFTLILAIGKNGEVVLLLYIPSKTIPVGSFTLGRITKDGKDFDINKSFTN